MLDVKVRPFQSAESLADGAYRRIEEMIVTRELPPGSAVSENRLSEELGCGRTPIREALLRLKHEGFVEILPSRGAWVAPIDVMKQIELLEVRRALEDLVVRRAAVRASAEERAEMGRLGAAMKAAAVDRDRKRYLDSNRAIHEIKARAARNTVLAKTMGAVNGLSRRFWYAYIEDTDSFAQAAELHDAALRPIIDGSPEEAAAAATRLLDFLESLTREAIDRRL